MLQHIIFDVAVYIFSMLQYMFFDVGSTYFSLLQYISFDIAVHVSQYCTTFFLMLQYLQVNVALFFFLHMFCNVAVEVFHALSGQRAR
jgi:hypothetical protein